MNDFAVEYWLI